MDMSCSMHSEIRSACRVLARKQVRKGQEDLNAGGSIEDTVWVLYTVMSFLIA